MFPTEAILLSLLLLLLLLLLCGELNGYCSFFADNSHADMVLLSFDDLFVFSPCQVTRGQAFKLFKRQNTHCVRANFFSERVINCWNSLPDSVDLSSFTTFRRTILNKSIFQDFSDINSHCAYCFVRSMLEYTRVVR